MKCFAAKVVSVYLIIALFFIGMVPRVEGGFIPSRPSTGERARDFAIIQKALEMKVIAQTLGKMGYTKNEIQSRLAAMSDRQIHEFASRIDDIRTGGDGVGAVVGVLVIIILVVVLLHLTGHRVIIT
jgi:hypothetical protein